MPRMSLEPENVRSSPCLNSNHLRGLNFPEAVSIDGLRDELPTFALLRAANAGRADGGVHQAVRRGHECETMRLTEGSLIKLRRGEGKDCDGIRKPDILAATGTTERFSGFVRWVSASPSASLNRVCVLKERTCME